MFPCEDWEQDWDWCYSPIGHETFGDEPWYTPEKTYDQDCASQGWISVAQWPARESIRGITWHFDSVRAEGVRISGYVERPFGPFINARVRAEVDGAWIVLAEYPCQWFPPGHVWEFGRGTLTKFEILIRHGCGAPMTLVVFEVAAGVRLLPCPGPLAPICKVFHAIGDFFSGLAEDIAGIMFVGGALSAPFVTLAETFHGLGDKCCEASGKLQEILDALEAGITPDTLLSIIQTHWPTLYSLITDPVGWFLVQLTLAFDLEPWHTKNLDSLVKYILQEYFPALYQVWLDPAGWLADILEEHFSLLYYLIVDPAGELLYLIALLFDLTPYEAQSPEFVVKALFERYFPSLYQLWRDMDAGLWEWLVDRYEDAFESIRDRLYVLAERTLRYFWEGEWGEVAEKIELWLTGVVTEAESPAIAGAVVTVMGTDLSDTTDAEGRYTIRGKAVAAPSYNLSVSRPGYRDTLVTGIITTEGVPTTVGVFMEFMVTPPEANPGPRLQRIIEVYQDTAEKLAWTQEILETKRGTPTEDFWAAQVADLTAWLTRTCESIGVLQVELQLYYGPAWMPPEYADLLDFQCG